MDPTSATNSPGTAHRRRLIAGGVALALAVLVLAWLLRAAPAPTPVSHAVPAALPLTVPAISPDAVVSIPRSEARGSLDSLCGRLQGPAATRAADPNTPTGLPPDLDAGLQQALDRLRAELARGSDAQRVLALSLAIGDPQIKALRAVERQHVPFEQARDEELRTSAAGRSAMVRLAQGSSDPDAYGRVYAFCGVLRAWRDPICTQLTAAEWARRAPDDLAAWLHAAAEASSTALRDEALHRAAQATRMSRQRGLHQQLLAAPWIFDLDVPQQLVLHLALASREVSITAPDYGPLMAACPPNAPLSPARRELCDSIARRLLDLDTSVFGRSVAIDVGRLAGWPAEPLATLERELDAMQWLTQQDQAALRAADGCERFAQYRERWLGVATDGHLPALRRRLAASGEDITTLAARYRALHKRPAPPPTTEAAAPPSAGGH